MYDAEILIIGGGPAGLSTAGALKHLGIESIVIDQGDRIGQSWEQRYERLHLHTVRAYSGLAHYPIPRTFPKYLSKDQYAAYLREYAAHFDLNIVPNTRALRVRPVLQDGFHGWGVDTSTKSWRARSVVIAIGQYGKPFFPEWPGLPRYGGQTLHSSQYRTGRAFQDRRVLVIGAGNSGLEIAVDLVEQGAAFVAVSVRSAPPVVPRDFLGTPAQVFGILMHALPSRMGDWVGQSLSRLALGDLSQFGLPAPVWQPFSSHRTPVIDVGFVSALKTGSVQIRPLVQSFTETGVLYADQREEPFDVVICATGFHTGLEQLLEPTELIDQNGAPRFPSGVPTSSPGLYFMGYFDSLRGFLYESNLASQRLAREIKGK